MMKGNLVALALALLVLLGDLCVVSSAAPQKRKYCEVEGSERAEDDAEDEEEEPAREEADEASSGAAAAAAPAEAVAAPTDAEVMPPPPMPPARAGTAAASGGGDEFEDPAMARMSNCLTAIQNNLDDINRLNRLADATDDAKSESTIAHAGDRDDAAANRLHEVANPLSSTAVHDDDETETDTENPEDAQFVPYSWYAFEGNCNGFTHHTTSFGEEASISIESDAARRLLGLTAEQAAARTYSTHVEVTLRGTAEQDISGIHASHEWNAHGRGDFSYDKCTTSMFFIKKPDGKGGKNHKGSTVHCTGRYKRFKEADRSDHSLGGPGGGKGPGPGSAGGGITS